MAEHLAVVQEAAALGALRLEEQKEEVVEEASKEEELAPEEQLGAVMSSRVPNGPQMSHDARQWLRGQGFTNGLIGEIEESINMVPFRAFIVDNSGSMSENDGRRIVGKQIKPCSRWIEVGECIRFHGELMERVGAPGQFRFINLPRTSRGHQFCDVGSLEAERTDTGFHTLVHTLESSPTGGTPLTLQVEAVRSMVEENAEMLARLGKKIIVVITSDGTPSEVNSTRTESMRRFQEALEGLRSLPVSLVVRLCTDDDQVVSFWNDMDCDADYSIDVIDDLLGEAREIAKHQPWLNYGMPLHRVREFGVCNPLFDLLDERPLSLDEAYQFMEKLLGKKFPDIFMVKEFKTALEQALDEAGNVLNPITLKSEPWVNIQKLKRKYYKKGCTVS